ncbi:MAG: hypothetical protein ACR2LE_09315 [Nocardioidaceae bacterium]
MSSTKPARSTAWLIGCLAATGLLAGRGVVPQPAQPPRAAHGTSAHGRWVDAEQAGREYVETSQQLTLRDGWRWPSDPVPPSRYQGEPVRYEVGYGRQGAQFHWYCSWSTAAVDRTLSPQQRHKALTTALRIRTMNYFTALNARNRRFFGRVLDHAANDHLRLLKQDVRLNCADEAG